MPKLIAAPWLTTTASEPLGMLVRDPLEGRSGPVGDAAIGSPPGGDQTGCSAG